MKLPLRHLLLSMTALTSIATAAPSWKVGEPFPALSLPTISGDDSFGVAKFRGQKVMLHVFASW